MRYRSVLPFLAIIGIVVLGSYGIASATAPSGVTPTAHVVGAALGDGVKVNADGVKLQTKGPAELSVLTLTLDPGATTGWHTHPGFAAIAVQEGVGRLYSSDCRAVTYEAGEAFVESGTDDATVFRNEGSTPVVLTVSFVAPRGSAIIRDEPAPAGCAIR